MRGLEQHVQYSREMIAEVLVANNIADVIGHAVELKPAGGQRLKGLCPFHHEKTPSFNVDLHRQHYHCFGCGKGGDALSFVIEQEGLSFIEALRKLADRGGVRLPAPSAQAGEAEDQRAKLLALNTFFAEQCRAALSNENTGAEARAYLERRALDPELAERFQLGYVPDNWLSFLEEARTKGFRDTVLEVSGLFRRGDRGGLYNFFRGRLTFPIRDVSGHVVAFGGRDLSGESPAKYINSPETLVYKKSRVLYGLNEAREAMRREKRVMLVEGYIDLLRCFSAGIENVVASCGTALTPEQASLVRRYVPEAVLVYDGDAAGIKAALKGIGILAAAGLTVRAMVLPNGQDPDDFIREHGGEAFQRLVAEAQDFVTFYVAHSAERMRTIEGRTEVAQEIFEILMELRDDTLRLDEYLKQVARAMGLQAEACRREFHRFQQKIRLRAHTPPPESAEQPAVKLRHDDCLFIGVLLDSAELLGRVRAGLEGLQLPGTPVMRVLEVMLHRQSVSISVDFEGDAAAGALYTAASNTELPEEETRSALVEKRLNRIVRDALDHQSAEIMEQLRQAERTRDTNLVLRLVAEKASLARRMEQVGAL